MSSVSAVTMYVARAQPPPPASSPFDSRTRICYTLHTPFLSYSSCVTDGRQETCTYTDLKPGGCCHHVTDGAAACYCLRVLLIHTAQTHTHTHIHISTYTHTHTLAHTGMLSCDTMFLTGTASLCMLSHAPCLAGGRRAGRGRRRSCGRWGT